jgi:O-antigen ligase
MTTATLQLDTVIDRSTAIVLAAMVGLPYGRAFLEMPSYTYFLLLAVLLVLAVARALLRLPFHFPALLSCLPLLALCAWLLVTGGWSHASHEQLDAAARVAGMLFLVIITALLVNERVAKAFAPCIAVFGCLASVHVGLGYVTAGSLEGFSANVYKAYLVAGSITGAAAIAATGLVVTAGTRRAALGWTLVAIVCLGGVALSLARGALVFSLLLSLVIVAYALIFNGQTLQIRGGAIFARWRPIAAFSVLLGLLTIAITAAMQIERTAARLERLFSGHELASGGRGELWSTALANIDRNAWVGYGLGSSGIKAGTTEALYPHNLLLQVWLDGGILALVAVLIWLACPVVIFLASARAQRIKNIALFCFFLFYVLEYMKSADFYTGRPIAIAGLLIIASVAGAMRPSLPDARTG